MNSCCFTGHRHIPPEAVVALKIDLDVALRSLIAKGVYNFYCGGALGFDTLAAQAVLQLKKTSPFLQLHFILPCKSQTDFWSDADRQVYSYLLSHADSVQCLYEEYNKNCMYERNRELVKSADVCVCYLKERSGGTAFTLALAAKRNLKIIPLGLNEEEKALFESSFLSPQVLLEDFEFDIP